MIYWYERNILNFELDNMLEIWIQFAGRIERDYQLATIVELPTWLNAFQVFEDKILCEWDYILDVN